MSELRRKDTETAIECGYAFDDDYESGCPHSCELPVGHVGPHRAALEWETRAVDICRAEGHIWPKRWKLIPDSPYLIDRNWMGWKKNPTHSRNCKRCGQVGYKGGESDPNFWRMFYPINTPSALGQIKVGAEFTPTTLTWTEDRLNG